MEQIDPVNVYMTKEYHKSIHQQISDFPTMLILQGSSYCNLTCLMCKRRVVVDKREKTGLGNGYISLELIEHIASQCSREEKFLGFQFALYGEPLMNPKIVPIIECIKSYDLKVQIVTNGSYLDRQMAESLMDAGLDKIKISFQGTTPEKYAFWRNTDQYEKVVENIHRLVKIKREKNSSLFIQVGTSSSDDTLEELEKFIAYWDKVVNHVYWNYTVLSHVEDDIEIAKRPMLRRAPRRIEKCIEPFKRMAVMWNGKVTQCVSDEEHFVGDLNEHTIRKVWNGDKMKNNRETIITYGNVISKTCEICCVQPPDSKKYDHRYDV